MNFQVKPLQEFLVRPALPQALSRMTELAYNLTAYVAVRQDKRKGHHALSATLVSCTRIYWTVCSPPPHARQWLDHYV